MTTSLRATVKRVVEPVLHRVDPHYAFHRARRDWDLRARTVPKETTATFDAGDWDRYWESGRRDLDLLWGVAREAGPLGAELAVEVGCGLGRITRPLAERFQQVVGVDISKEMLRQARAHAGATGIRYELVDATHRLPVGDGTADLVLAWTVFRHTSKSTFARYLEEARRVLKSQGCLVFEAQIRESGTPSEPAPYDSLTEREYTRAELQTYCATRGFHWAADRTSPSVTPGTFTLTVAWTKEGEAAPEPAAPGVSIPIGMRTALRELAQMTVWEGNGGVPRAPLYGPGDAGAQWHREFDAQRLQEFFELVLDEKKTLRVLELGANPYLLTYALARAGVAVVAAGHPLPALQPTLESVEFKSPDGLVVLSIPLYRFNVESDPFPFADGSFDVVVCGELIEHLVLGPEHLLFECNRILAPGGRLLLSTPNAVSLARLIAIARGVNPDWPFSPQGVYCRHNRLYTSEELRDLLVGNAFRPYLERGLTFTHKRSWYRPGPVGALKWAGLRALQQVLEWQPYRLRRFAEGLLVAALKVDEPRRYRPTWLFGAADSVPIAARSSEAGGAG
jgi:SAM-dependent methyltransferase